ncbi:MAG: gliding motility-associated C-terminal domain-containing protein, partial [Bacteroidales bacterium]|nr:gliding motility-associated C-terminal domain-containing protein [Bacteroidales bacterium]
YGGNDGSVTVAGLGGTPPYQYRIGSEPYQASGTFGSLVADSYVITVQDDNLCTVEVPVTITQPLPPFSGTISSQTNISCYGGNNGSATAEGIGGLPPYEYSLDGGPYQASGTFASLNAGTYTITIRDAFSDTYDLPLVITEPDLLVIQSIANDATCPDEPNGSILLTITGGTEPYTIIWSDGAGMQNRINMLPGTYSVVVTDQNGCSQSHSVAVGFIGSYNCVEISNIITPNSDGFNDEWILRNIDLYPNAEVLVFNRWGKLIFRTKNISANPWDGTSEGRLVPTDSYHYILYLNDGSEPKTGVISVIR